jgi:predicted ATPase
MAERKSRLKPPYLRKVRSLVEPDALGGVYPFDIPFLSKGNIKIDIRRSIAIIVGDNGVGKSTLMEAIAAQCGFSLIGGSKNHVTYDTEQAPLSKHLRLSWLPKMSAGFFLRAETMLSFIRAIDDLARETGRSIYDAYGGRSLAERSHGEAFLSLFEHRFGRQGIYIMDEPEAALSPERQLDFLRLLRRLENSGQSQVIIATHSVLVMAYPGAQIIRLTSDGPMEVEFQEMPHFRLMRDFCSDPDSFMAGVFHEV